MIGAARGWAEPAADTHTGVCYQYRKRTYMIVIKTQCVVLPSSKLCVPHLVRDWVTVFVFREWKSNRQIESDGLASIWYPDERIHQSDTSQVQ
jgi:hypothetical protein